MRAVRSLATLLALLAWLGAPAGAQDAGAWPAPSTPSVPPRPDFRFPGNVGRTILNSDPPQFPQPVEAPEGAPNVVLILLDDVGEWRRTFVQGRVFESRPMTKVAATASPSSARWRRSTLAGAAPSVLGRRHDLCRNLVRDLRAKVRGRGI